MAGYDFLDSDGTKRWTCRELDEHADCVWVADLDADGAPEIVIGEGGLYAYGPGGVEIWRNTDPREVQHVAPGNYRRDLPGLQVAGLDRIVRGGRDRTGQDGIFLVDREGAIFLEEDRDPGGEPPLDRREG